MTEQTAIIGASNGLPVAIDVDRLVGSHAAIIANSGGGKSGLLRRLLEQTHGNIQHIILDVEDEFYTLRERFDYVIAGGDDGDIPVSVDGAKALALGALEHGFSLIVQLNDLGAAAGDFVAAFLNAMIHAPRDLWHPALIVIDEAQRFAPSGGTETPAARAVKSLTAQGRKRGFTAILASQRIAKIDANVRGDINNWMLGRVGQALDRNAMADQLGFSAREGRERLAGIADRHFWGFGPAVAAEPVLFRVADVETTPVRPGQAKVLTPPPAGALADILAGLIVEPAKVDSSEQSSSPSPTSSSDAELRARVRELEAERDNWTIEQAFGQRQLDALVAENQAIRDIAQRFTDAAADLALIRPALSDMADWPKEIPAQGGGGPQGDEGQTEVRLAPRAAPARQREAQPQPAPAREAPASLAGSPLTNSAKKMLDVVVRMFPRAMPLAHIAKMAGVSATSSQWRANRQSLLDSGLVNVTGAGLVDLSRKAQSQFNVVGQPDTPAAARAFWLGAFPPATSAMLQVLIDAGGEWLHRDVIADRAGVSRTSSGLSGGLRELRDHGVIVSAGHEHCAAAVLL